MQVEKPSLEKIVEFWRDKNYPWLEITVDTEKVHFFEIYIHNERLYICCHGDNHENFQKEKDFDILSFLKENIKGPITEISMPGNYYLKREDSDEWVFFDD